MYRCSNEPDPDDPEAPDREGDCRCCCDDELDPDDSEAPDIWGGCGHCCGDKPEPDPDAPRAPDTC